MCRSNNHGVGIAVFRYSGIPLMVLLLASCTPRVATSFWRIGTPADSTRASYTVIHAEGKTRHCYPVTEWSDLPEVDTYHQLHHHGVAVESEWMAYRIYFDKKQTIDPYCKRTPQLELAQSYWYPDDSLLAAGYGDDILRVSGTVGVGSVKFWDGKMHHFDHVTRRSQRIVSRSRRAATIEVADHGLVLPESAGLQAQPIDLQVHYTMRAGHRDLRCDVYSSRAVAGLCTGVQSIPAKGANEQSSTFSLELPNGMLLGSWGTDWPVNDSAKYAKETVGIAVFIPKRYAGEQVGDKRNMLCLLNMETGTAHFYLTCCGATKENHPVARNATEWLNYLRRWAKNLK